MTPRVAGHRTRRLPLRWLAPFLLLVAAPLLPARALAAEPAEFWKYYVVTTGADGRPERLRDISARLLGDGARYSELVALNGGRRQPDGGVLSDPEQLRAGWILALPWDAAGGDVRYGVLPGVGPVPSASPAPSPSAGACPERAPDRLAPDGLPWAQLRFDLDGAWDRGRGTGVAVAIVDGGVDASVPALAGRVRPGVGESPATVDCTGHGTAMAGIAAARAKGGGRFSGMAPEAEIVPVRVRTGEGGRAAARDAADAVALAVDAGASVVALTIPTDTAAPEVAAAIDAAVTQDVAVVVPASAAGPGPGDRPGLLRVGGVGADGAPSEPRQGGGVDVLAPGIGVTTIGTAGRPPLQGTGSDFAAPFAAGLLALVRAAAPELSAVDATQIVEATADRDGGSPDPATGWGFIDPVAAVTAAVAARPDTTGEQATGTGGAGQVALLVAGLGTFVAAWQVPLWLVRRRRVR
ncbi:S8 family serine peptidase [Catenuloplanes atrovinosus]|uniref:Peptidase S8/S53 domain-containing protein n=1 Tax=Catenuloplanes atrovinosus TaxID=137266 RepID=A0AAE3YL07_9ACTN|nr:S8 family serine peptidase [Catenuloplanes atrovinosus]MDR7274231.1 hypothetical protein [Catenuloplanes atrovinosus]